MAKLEFSPIGTIYTPFTKRAGMPIQPAAAAGIQGKVVLLPDYTAGLQDVDGFSHLILIYHFHRSDGFDLRVVPFLDTQPRGLFATRAPKRPNPIGLSIVRLKRIEGHTLFVADVDVLDGTPLLDLKPYVPAFDSHPQARTGWLTASSQDLAQKRADDRFSEDHEPLH